MVVVKRLFKPAFVVSILTLGVQGAFADSPQAKEALHPMAATNQVVADKAKPKSTPVSNPTSRNAGNVLKDQNQSFPQKNRRIGQGLVEVIQPGQAYFETLPSTTFDLALLQHRNEFGMHQLDLSGYLEFDAQYWHAQSNLVTGTNGAYLTRNGSGVYLTTADLDAMSNLNEWVTAFVKLDESSIGTESEVTRIRKALVTIGNLDKAPFFMTVGKSFLPFGTYAGGGAWSVPLTRSVFRPDEVPQVLVGYYKNGFNSNIAVFDANNSRFVHDFVYSFYYTSPVHNGMRAILGGAYLNDLRGLPSGLGSAYQSDGVLSSAKRIPAWDASFEFDFKQWQLTGEYLTAMRQGDYNSNATSSGQTVASAGQSQGRPSAWELGTAFSNQLLGKAMTYSLSYSRAYHMAGIPMGLSSQPVPGPSAMNGLRSSLIVSAARTIKRNIIVGLEWQRGNTYANKAGWVLTGDLSVYF